MLMRSNDPNGGRVERASSRWVFSSTRSLPPQGMPSQSTLSPGSSFGWNIYHACLTMELTSSSWYPAGPPLAEGRPPIWGTPPGQAWSSQPVESVLLEAVAAGAILLCRGISMAALRNDRIPGRHRGFLLGGFSSQHNTFCGRRVSLPPLTSRPATHTLVPAPMLPSGRTSTMTDAMALTKRVEER